MYQVKLLYTCLEWALILKGAYWSVYKLWSPCEGLQFDLRPTLFCTHQKSVFKWFILKQMPQYASFEIIGCLFQTRMGIITKSLAIVWKTKLKCWWKIKFLYQSTGYVFVISTITKVASLFCFLMFIQLLSDNEEIEW